MNIRFTIEEAAALSLIAKKNDTSRSALIRDVLVNHALKALLEGAKAELAKNNTQA